MNSSENLSRKEPAIICHPACSGGTVIYRELLKRLGMWGVSEVSHACIPQPGEHVWLDPETQLFAQRKLSLAEFSKIFFDRIRSTERLAAQAEQRLLIREHSHRYFFNPLVDGIDLESVSWVVDQYRLNDDRFIKTLVSVRDPIDCWLGLRHSFPRERPRQFDAYCQRYLDFVKAADRTTDCLLFKYEDFVSSPDSTTDEISAFLNLSPLPAPSATSVHASGNSGRSGEALSLRRRRAYTNQLVHQADRSRAYQELIERLDYPPIRPLSFPRNLGSRLTKWTANLASRSLSFTEWAIGVIHRRLPEILE